MERFKPHAYQTAAIKFLREHPNAGLFLDMGLGKSVITLTAIRDWIYDECRGYKALVIAPAKVAETTWTAERNKWAHLQELRIVRVRGTPAQRVKALNTPADVYTISNCNVVWLVEYLKKAWPFGVVVIDESSAFKSHTAKRFRAMRKVRPYAERLIELTGTPAPNGLLDLWSQLYLLDSGARLGKTFTAYREAYFKPDKRDALRVFTWKPRKGAEDEIFAAIGDVCMSLKAEDYLELPELIENVVEVELTDGAYKAINDFERDWLLELDDTPVTAPTASVLAGKMLQLANGAAYDTDGKWHELHDAKLEALKERIECSCGNPVLVFYAFRHDLERLKAAIPDAVEYRGDAEYRAWNKGRIRVLLAHPASIGYGLNLQAGGNIIVWFGLTFSLELYQQSIARLWRQGQTKPVIVHYLVAKGTFDERLLPALRKKEQTQNRLLEAVKAEIVTILHSSAKRER